MSEPESVRDVPVDEAVRMAISFHRQGHLEDALDVYRKVLAVVPDHIDALHFSGLLAHQQGRSAEGLELIRQSLEVEPDQADAWSNLGIVYKALGKLEEAIGAYKRAIALRPEHANAYCNLGVLLRAQGQNAEAEAAYRTAVRLDPRHVETHHNLGLLLAATGRTKEAVECYCRVTTLSPAHPQAKKLLILAHCTLGEFDQASRLAREWVAAEPGNAVAVHTLASCSGENVPARASDEYVERVFDEFASSFDTKLANLAYQAPQLMTTVLETAEIRADGRLDVLDAGCGTGLCGPLLAPYARRLVGVDLSSKMLEQAQARAVYHELVKGELTAFLERHPAAFDLVVSADTLVYFGALESVLAAAAGALRPGGTVIFSLEEDTKATPGSTYSLQPHGRYTHAPAYVEDVLRAVGLQPHMVRAELRMESGEPVVGVVMRAVKAQEGSRA